MHMDESAVMSGPFLFISYNHEDAEAVREDVSQLIDRGVRIWIDHRSEEEENLTLGDNWLVKVKEAIFHPNCRGAIFYLSQYSLASKAIHKEQRLVLEKADRETFPYYCVSMGAMKISRHFSAAVALCSDETSKWYNEAYMEGDDDIFSIQRTMFNDNKIFIPRQTSAECVDLIYEKVAAPLGVVDHAGALMFSLEESRIASKDTGEIVFGIYKGEKSEPVARSVENARFRLGGKNYIHHNGLLYTGRPMKWRLLYTHNAVAVLICTEVVERSPETEVNAFLQTFLRLAFTQEEMKLVRRIRLFNEEDEARTDAKSKDALLSLGSEQEKMYWWVDRQGIMPGWKLTYRDNKPMQNGFLVTRPKGIRPVIEIEAEDLKRIKGV